jgi:hypothetical protein
VRNKREGFSYLIQVEDISDTLIMRWVNVQLTRVSEWVDRTLHQEVAHDPLVIDFFISTDAFS